MTNFRSTRGASKHRRDLINGEILNLRDMLPLSESARQRLSQLQIMSLGCVFIRKCNYFARLFGNSGLNTETPFEFSQAMTGFLLITTREGKMLYISENVTEFLGHSMVDMMTQGDSLYDIIDKRDHSTVQNQLLHTPYNPGSNDERNFFCRMNVARSFRRQAGFGEHKVMHVRGHFIQPVIRDHYGNQPVFMAMCSPLLTPDVKESIIQNNTSMFQSVHGLDMKYIEIATNGEHHLGYNQSEISGKSWYEMLHPEDIHEAREKHIQLIKSSHEMGCMLTVRLQNKFGDWVWVNVVMHIRQPFVCDNGDPAIVCVHQVIQESEAQSFKVQSQLYSSHIARSPEFLSTQGGSPSHTITQVQTDPMTGYNQMPPQHREEGGAGYYHAEFGVTVTPALQEVRNTNGNGVVVHSNGSNGYTVGGVQKKLSTADILIRLKRKINTKDNQQTQHCKPAKMPRFTYSSNSSDSDGSSDGSAGGIRYSASAVVAPVAYDSGSGGSMAQVFMPVSQQPVYTQLAFQKDVQLISKQATVLIDINGVNPPSPLTPNSPGSVGSPQMMTTMTSTTLQPLCVDTYSDAALVPPSILTPESSPACSPAHQGLQTLSDDQLPSMLVELEEEMSIFADELAKPEPKRTPTPESAQPLLPILDGTSIDSFFASVESSICGTRSRVKQQQQQQSVCPPQVGRAGTLPTSVASSMNTQQNSPVVVVEKRDNVSKPASVKMSSDDLVTLNEAQLTSLVASVTDAILDMVQKNTDDSVDVQGGFMVVPEQAAQQKVDSDQTVQSVVDTMLGSLSDEETDELLSPMAGDFFNELHQLNELAGSSTSFGNVDLTSCLLNQNP